MNRYWLTGTCLSVLAAGWLVTGCPRTEQQDVSAPAGRPPATVTPGGGATVPTANTRTVALRVEGMT